MRPGLSILQNVGGLISSPVDYREKALRCLGDLPPFSPILNKLLATLAAEDVSFARIAELIEKDTVLAGNVLRLVNSALYGRRGTINSVRHAVSLMGLVKLRNSAMTLSVSQVWSNAKTPKSWTSVGFNLHAVATGVMSDLLAQRVLVKYPEGAFVAGLLHDIGLLLIAISLPDEFGEIRELYETSGKEIEECEREIIGLEHPELSAAVLAEWNLPEPIQKAVRYRRNSERQISDELPLSKVLHVADAVVNAKGITVMGKNPGEQLPEDILAAFNPDQDPKVILEDFHREFEPMKTFF